MANKEAMGKDVPVGALSPTMKELEWLSVFCVDHSRTFQFVLEWGCGATTQMIWSRIRPRVYEVVETYQPAIDRVRMVTSGIRFRRSAVEISLINYDMVLIDSSEGFGHHGLDRLQPLKFSEKFIEKGCVVIVHDAHGRSSRDVMQYLRENRKQYAILDEFRDRTGFAAYERL